MPTGYTANVVDGKQTEFPAFAMTCARAFGALIMMRDEPSDAPIPDQFKPSDYSEKRLAEARARMAELQAMTPEQAEAAAIGAYEEAVNSNAKYLHDRQVEDARLDAMLEKVRAWTPPTAEHVELKAFMEQQISVSKSSDYRPAPPKKLSGRDWLTAEIEKAHHDIGYHAAEHAKEIARCEGRSAWVKALRQSLENVNA